MADSQNRRPRKQGFQIRQHAFEAKSIAPALYIAATPIGNLGDITLRVLEVLAGCDVIACEDTRVTAKLLRHYGISNKTVSYNEHNANVSGMKLIEDLEAGKTVCLVSDAGTPLVSDPGSRLVISAQEAGIPVVPLPGASAPVTALVASGLPAETWTFAGFLPNKQGARKSRLEELTHAPGTVVFFESPNRLAKSLADMSAIFGDCRQAVVAREITKMHEEISRGSLEKLEAHFSDQTVKGEIVILVGPAEKETISDPDALLRELLETMPVSKAAAEAVSLTGLSKRELYNRALVIKENR